MNFAKKCAAAIFALSLFLTSCSLSAPSASGSKIYLITIANDYYNITSILSDCVNDNYGMLGQFNELASKGNIESLAFITQLGQGYVMENFDKSKFAKYGTMISAYTPSGSANSKPKGAWVSLVKNGISDDTSEVNFRIGKSGLDIEQAPQEIWNNPENWGADLITVNSNPSIPGSRAKIVYKDSYDVYKYTYNDDDKTYKYSVVASIQALSEYPFCFEYKSENITDSSGYSSKNYQSSSNIKDLYNLYGPEYLYKLGQDDDYTKFSVWKVVGQTPQKWAWRKGSSSSTEDCIYASEKIKNWLSSKVLSPDDVIVFYYSGHGVDGVINNPDTGDKDLVTENDGALVMPAETNGSTVSVKPKELLDLFNIYDCHKFFILDSCYSGNFINYTGSELYDCDEYAVAYTKGDSWGKGRSVFDYYLGSSNIFTCLMGGISDTGISKYKNTWVITGSTFLNPSLSGVDIYGGTSIRYGAMTSCILNRIGYDVTRSEVSGQNKGKRITVYDIMDGILSDFPKLYRAYYEVNGKGEKVYRLDVSQNPQMKRSTVDLILF